MSKEVEVHNNGETLVSKGDQCLPFRLFVIIWKSQRNYSLNHRGGCGTLPFLDRSVSYKCFGLFNILHDLVFH